MSGTIHLGAILVRDGQVLLARAGGEGAWELPGGPLLPTHEDVDAGMDAILATFGVAAPAVEDDFLETIYLPGDGGPRVYNLYAPSEWRGEPEAPAALVAAWFSPGELAALNIEPAVREAVLVMLGLADPRDESAAIEAALLRAMPSEPGGRAGDAARALAEMAQAGIEPAMRDLLVVAVRTAAGAAGRGVRAEIGEALDHGATPEQVVATLGMVEAYVGPAASAAVRAELEAALKERGIPQQVSSR
ncbi:MAG: carboxymuconolactone decarboxylase family protein [Dehalococcoidia bacterium]